MTCERAREIDVDAFLLDSGTPEFDDFRSHYVDCDVCSNIVSGWSALDLAVEQAFADALGDSDGAVGGPSWHPNAAQLLAILKRREGDDSQREVADSLTPNSATKLESHIDACGACQTNLRMMSRFDPAALADIRNAAGGSHAVRAGDAHRADRADRALGTVREAGLLESIRDFLQSISESLFSPGVSGKAFPAMAMGIATLLLLGLWFSGRLSTVAPDLQPRGGVEIVEVERPKIDEPRELQLPEIAVPNEKSPIVPDAPQLAEIRPPPPPPSPRPSASPPSAGSPPERAPHISPAPSSPEEAFSRSPLENSGPAEILLASVDHLDRLRYAAPAGPHDIAWMANLDSARGDTSLARASVLAPADHVGLTASSAPRLWWRLTKSTDHPVQLIVIEDGAADAVVETLLTGPKRAGLGSADLSDYGVELRPDVDYRWFVSVVDDPDRPSRNVTSAGALRRISEGDARRAELASAKPTERGLTLARLGLWYDAYDFYASLAEKYPEDTHISALRDRLASFASPDASHSLSSSPERVR